MLGLLPALLVCELWLALFHPVDLHPTDVFLEQHVSQAHAGLMSLRPNTAMRMRTSEFDVAIRINGQGLRDRTFSPEPPAGALRVLVLGDSQTFGYGVEAEQTYPKLLEAELSRELSRPVEVINAGVPGTGTAQQLHFLEEAGWALKPDMVIVGVFPFNDLGDNGLSRLFAVRNGRLERVNQVVDETKPLHEVALWQEKEGDYRVVRPVIGPGPPPETPWLIRRSHLARLVRDVAAGVLRRQATEIPWHSPRHARELSRLLLAEVRRQCEERGAAFLTLVIPSRADFGDLKPDQVEARDSALVSLLPPEDVINLHLDFARRGPKKLFYRSDLHLTPSGHQAAAEILLPRVADKLATITSARASQAATAGRPVPARRPQ